MNFKLHKNIYLNVVFYKIFKYRSRSTILLSFSEIDHVTLNPLTSNTVMFVQLSINLTVKLKQ